MWVETARVLSQKQAASVRVAAGRGVAEQLLDRVADLARLAQIAWREESRVAPNAPIT